MTRPIWIVLLLVSTLAAAGCLDGTPLTQDACPEPVVSLFYGQAADGRAPRAPSQPVTVLAWATNPADQPAEVTVTPEDVRGSAAVEGLQADAGRHHGIIHRLGPDETGFGFYATEADAEAQDHVRIRGSLGPDDQAEATVDCQDAGLTRWSVGLAEPQAGDTVETGKGVLVHTVGLWTNGTSFYTNLDRFHEREDLPKGYLGEYGGGDPLKVYVYDESPDEMPRRYEEAGYAVTIPGFNEALKGMSTTAPRTAYLTPEEGYTREGNEDHDLYGDALVFYIEAVEVVEEPCTVPEPVCDVPTTPDPPPPASPVRPS